MKKAYISASVLAILLIPLQIFAYDMNGIWEVRTIVNEVSSTSYVSAHQNGSAIILINLNIVAPGWSYAIGEITEGNFTAIYTYSTSEGANLFDRIEIRGQMVDEASLSGELWFYYALGSSVVNFNASKIWP